MNKLPYPALFNAFKLWYCSMYFIFFCIAIAWFNCFVETNIRLAESCLIALGVFGFCELQWCTSYGHGVYTNRKKILGFPSWSFFVLLTTSTVLILIYVLSSQNPAVLVGSLFGFTLGCMRWQFTMYYCTWHDSEYNLRANAWRKMAKGDLDEKGKETVIKFQINKVRETGYFDLHPTDEERPYH